MLKKLSLDYEVCGGLPTGFVAKTKVNTTFRPLGLAISLTALAADATGELDVFRHDGHTLGVDRTQVGVFEEGHEVSLSGLLKSNNCGSLESKVVLEVLGNLTNKPLEGKLAHEKLSGLLVSSNFSEGDGSWSISMGLFDTSSCRRALSGGFSG